MNVRQPRRSMQEHARLGRELYDREVRAKVEAGNAGNIVAIDIDSGEFELGDDVLIAAERLLAKHPDAQIWFVRISRRGVHRFGARAMAVDA